MQNQEEKALPNRPKWELKTKAQLHPAKRWCHTATVYKSHLYLVGGRLPESAKSKEFAYRINCQTFDCEPILLSENPLMRESHSCALVSDSFYVLFGVDKSSKVLDDCLQLKMMQNNIIWRKKGQNPSIGARESHMSVVLENRYILIYGGIDNEEKQVEEFYIYDLVKQSWRKVEKVQGKIQAKVGGTLINIKNQIYFFGGQFNDQNSYTNEIYRIYIQHDHDTNPDQQPQIQIVKLNPIGPKPLPRSQFASVSYKDRYLIILGGETPTKQSNFPVKLLNDIWIFDTQKLVWEEIVPENPQVFKPRSSFTANIYKESLIVFGGLVSFKDYKSSDQILVLNLSSETEKKPVCNLCRSSFKLSPQQEIQVAKGRTVQNSYGFSTTFSMISAISRTIQDPFIALGNLLHSFDYFQVDQCSIILSQILRINLKKIRINDFQWQHILWSYNFEPLIQERNERVRKALSRQIYLNKLNYLSYNIKNSCLRLGNEMLISRINSRDELQLCLINKFGIYHLKNCFSENQTSPNQCNNFIVLQFLKEYNIDPGSLFQHQMTICLTSLKKQSSSLNRELRFDKNNQDIFYRDYQLKSYFDLAFAVPLSLKLSVSDQELLFSQQNYFHPGGNHNNEKWPQQNRYLHLFQNVYTYSVCGNSKIFVYQNNKLMHTKEMNKNYGLAFEFHLTKNIEPNLTFSDVLPTSQLLEAIKKTVKKLSPFQNNGTKREKSLEREQLINNEQESNWLQISQSKKKMVKINEQESMPNGHSQIQIEKHEEN